VAYHVEKTINNGYRCGCCHRDWIEDAWFEDRAEALAEVPRSHDSGDFELEKIEVRDSASGAIIASAQLVWCGGRSERYRYQRWSGIIDGECFEELRGGQSGDAWSDIVARVQHEAAEAKLKDAEAKLKAAEAEAARWRAELARTR